MWTSFALAAGICVLALYVPGFLIGKALRFSGVMAACFAPVASMSLFALIAAAMQVAGIPAAATSIAVLAVGCGAVMWAASAGWAHARGGSTVLRFGDGEAVGRKGAHAAAAAVGAEGVPTLLRRDWPLLLVYVLVGVAVCAYLFVSVLGTPDTLYCSFDTQTHLNTVKAFLDSGQWSVFNFTNYLTAPPEAIPYASVGGFYPGAWHVLAAFACDAAGAPVTVGENALLAVMCGVVFPTSMFAFVRSLFAEDRLAVVLGAILACSFVAFPWGPMHNGPLYPNQAGDIIMAAVIGLSMAFIESGEVRQRPVAAVVFALFALASMVLTHPNTLFALFVFAVPYAVHLAWRALGASTRVAADRRRLVQIGVSVGICLVALLFWVACVNLPFMQHVVNFDGTADHDLFNAVVMLGSLKLNVFKAQFVLSAAVLAGTLSCLRAKRFWLIVPPALMAVAFVGALLPDSELTKYLAGFWYCQGRRIASVIVVFLAPIAARGLAAACRVLSALLARTSASSTRARKRANAGAFVLVAVFSIVVFVPNIGVPGSGKVLLETPFGHTRDVLAAQYTTSEEQVYSVEERAFVREVEKTIGADALVLNQPNDGSVWAYGADGLNTYFRYMDAGKNERAKTIRLGLDRYATDADVKAAVDYTGAKYLIKLDNGATFKKGTWLTRYTEKKHKAWSGVDAVNDNTPGFTVVLSKGDMRLYEIG